MLFCIVLGIPSLLIIIYTYNGIVKKGNMYLERFLATSTCSLLCWILVYGGLSYNYAMSSFNSSLCYIESDGRYLMLHRTKKEHDLNEGKWIGLGGHFEEGEYPYDCVKREVFEESGIELLSPDYRGIVTFVYGNETEYMHLFTASLPEGFSDTLPVCDEGELAWIKKDEIENLNIWEGDRVFLKLLRDDAPFFMIKLDYGDGSEVPKVTTIELKKMEYSYGEELVQVANNPQVAAMLTDDFPNPYTEDDALSFITLCKNNPDSVQMERAVFVDGRFAGMVGLTPGTGVHRGTGELGYWLGREFWDMSIGTTAVLGFLHMIDESFDLRRIEAHVFSVNKRSARLLEKCGFKLEATHKDSIIKNDKVMDELVFAKV